MEKLKKLESFSVAVIAYFMLLIMSFLTVVSFFEDAYFQIDYVETIYYKPDSIAINLLFLAVTFFVLISAQKKRLYEKVSIPCLVGALLLYSMLICLLWIHTSQSIPRADSAAVLNSVEAVIDGDFSAWDLTGYMRKYPNQWGIALLFEIIFRLFNGGKVSYYLIRIFQMFMIAGIFWGMHLITKEITEKNEIIVIELVLSFGWIPLMLYVVFVYGVIPGLFCAIYGILCTMRFLQNGESKYAFGLIILISLASILKSNYLIFAIAIAIILLVKAIQKKRGKLFLISILLIISISGLSRTVTKIYEVRSEMELTDGMPASAWIAMGMQEGPMGEGWYNGYSSQIYKENGYSTEAADEVAKEFIKQQIAAFIDNPRECLTFYYKKVVSQWNEATYESLWIARRVQQPESEELGKLVNSIYEGKLHIIVEEFMNLYQLLIYLGTALCAWKLRKSRDLKDVLLLLCILGGFLFHILWEAKSQYIFPYVTLMLPCAAMGFSYVIENVSA